MSYKSKYKSSEIENLLDKVASGNTGGGSSSGSGAYAEVNHGTSDTTFTLTPNTFHVWDEISALTLTLGSETTGVANEYLFQFTSGATATTLTLPDDIKWANDSAPAIAENMIYQVSILKGMASVLEFDNAPQLAFPITLVMGDNGSTGISLYQYLQNKYGEATAGTAITEEIYNGAQSNLLVSSIEYGTYRTYTGYWLNGYGAMKVSWCLSSDGYLTRVLPMMD